MFGKVLLLGQDGCIREKWFVSGKVVAIGQKWLYSGKLFAFGKE